MERSKITSRILVGHCLGHYNALMDADSIRYEDALKIVKIRAELTDRIIR